MPALTRHLSALTRYLSALTRYLSALTRHLSAPTAPWCRPRTAALRAPVADAGHLRGRVAGDRIGPA
jgi:hypothetical protein